MKEKILTALKKYFGFDGFRPLQEEIVTTIASGQDCLAILPTGGGKSLCFQLPGLLMDGNVLVISPLISLMTDQVEHLAAKGISAISVHSGLGKNAKESLLRSVLECKFKFIYVSPETLASQWFQHHANVLNIDLIVIDEAHCISEWGDTFRPEYRKIHTFVSLLKKRPVMAAFTASATPRTAQDITQQLELKNEKFFRQSIIRPNLSLNIIPCETKTIQYLALLRILKKHESSPIIIYGATRVQTEATAQQLSQLGVPAEHYHGGLTSEERARIQHDFLDNTLRIICATTAFGMGVDKPDIRCVIHLTHPASLEHYYQEVGRAGRDGKDSWCYLLSLPGDGQLQHDILSKSYPPFAAAEAVLTKVFSHNMHKLEELYAPLQKVVSVYDFRQVLDKGIELKWWIVDYEKKILELQSSPRDICEKFHKLTTVYNHHCRKLLKMINYTQRKSCRMRQLLGYFEPVEDHPQYHHYTCNKCDHCTVTQTHQPTTAEQRHFKTLVRTFLSKRSLVKRNLDWSLAGLTIELIAATETYLGNKNFHYPGVGRGLKTVIDLDEGRPQTHLWQTEHAAQGRAS